MSLYLIHNIHWIQLYSRFFSRLDKSVEFEFDPLVEIELYVDIWALFKDDILTPNNDPNVSFTRLCGIIFCQTSPLNTKTCPDYNGFNIDTSLICSIAGFCELCCDDVPFVKKYFGQMNYMLKNCLGFIYYIYIFVFIFRLTKKLY